MARLLRGQRQELAVRVMAHVRELSADGVRRGYQATLPERSYLTFVDIEAKGGRALLFQAPRPLSSIRRVTTLIARSPGASRDGGWFVGLTPTQHRAVVGSFADAIGMAVTDVERLPGAVVFDPHAPTSATGLEAELDEIAIQEARALDAPAPGRDPGILTVTLAAVALAAAMLAPLGGSWAGSLVPDLRYAGIVLGLVLAAVAVIAGVVAGAVGPEYASGRFAAVAFALVAGFAVIPACLSAASSTADSLVAWSLAIIVSLLAWASALGVYGSWWLALALPIAGGAVGAPVGAALDGDGTGWGLALGTVIVLLPSALAVTTLLRSPTLVAHRRTALAKR